MYDETDPATEIAASSRCASCGSGRTTSELYSVAPGLSICRSCVDTGVSSSKVFFDILYVIQSRLRQAVKALRHTVVHRDGLVGWYHYIAERNVGFSSTAYAVALLKQLDPSFPELRAAADTVRRAFVRQAERPSAGGWPMASIPDVILPEPTCYCAGQLIAAGFLELGAPEAEGAINWLLAEQREDGAWTPQRHLPESCYVTALVVQTLAQWYSGLAEPLATRVETATQKGMRWLSLSVNQDGGWGPIRERESDPWHTAHALSAISSAGDTDSNDLSVAAIDYLLRAQGEWSQVINSSYEVEAGSQIARAHYVFHPRPIVIQALLRSGASPQHSAILAGVLETLSMQDIASGEWRYPGATRGTIFELCHNAACLREFAERASSVGSLVDLHHEMNKLEARLNATIDQVSRYSGQGQADDGGERGSRERHGRRYSLAVEIAFALSLGSVFLSTLPRVRPAVPDRTAFATTLAVSAGGWLIIKALGAESILARLFYAVLLAILIFVTWAFVVSAIQTLLFPIVVAVLIATAQLLAPWAIGQLRGGGDR